jgi:hypothetical protein
MDELTQAMRALEAAVEASKVANSKFEAKLTFARRCEILALHRMGCTREALAELYGVDRRTITHIHNPKSPRYKNVREEELRLGKENFLKEYLDTDMLNAAASKITTKITAKEENNKKSNRMAGVHTMRNEFCDYDHRVIIKWLDADPNLNAAVSGWYYQDLDSEWPTDWFHGDAESLRTSQSCFNHAKMDISDKL